MAITEHMPLARSAPEGRRRYVRTPQPIHFPVSEEMPETNRHLELRTALYVILKRELAARATLGSEQFIYYDPTTAKKKLAPDAFAKLGQPHETFRCWKTWLRGAPELAVEVVSDSDEGEEPWNQKLARYRAAGIGEVVRFDPDNAKRPIRVWDHIDGDLVERKKSDDGAYECVPLDLFWVAVAHPAFVRMLRLARDRAGTDLLLTPDEAELVEARARAEAERARAEEARARAEAERARAEEAQSRAEAERARAEEAQSRAEAERARALEAQSRAEAERDRDRLAAEVAELRKQLAEQSSRTSARDAAKGGAGAPRATSKKTGK